MRIGTPLALAALICFLMISTVSAAVTPNQLFSDNAVLQRQMNVPVWGTANDGEKVTVKIQKQEVSTIAHNGRWMVWLKPLQVGGPFIMTISGSDNTVELKNILVGDVWICSGQSNMEFHLAWGENAKQNMEQSGDPQIRLLTVPKIDDPFKKYTVSWKECGPTTSGDFSAVGYSFAKHLKQDIKVPIGMINASWGGTVAETWTSKSCLTADPMLSDVFTYKYNGANRPAALYNAMIAPLQPYAIKGAIWYQGESNAGHAYEYRRLFPTMIQCWRNAWGEGDFPFFFVQLAPFMKLKDQPMDSSWAELREAQLLTSLQTPNTGMAVITDFGDQNDIHPKPKEPVGERLALAARGIAYGEKIVYSGPIYKSMKIEGGKGDWNVVSLSFDHVGGGLVAKDGELKSFTIAGEDQKFVNAKAEIVGNNVVVFNPDVKKPVAVRYGWADFPVVNLYNKEGLPTSPFRTDDFQVTTQPKAVQ